MKILATFVNWKHDPEAIDLVCAWDEYSVDNNFDGYTKDRDQSIASYGTEIQGSVTVEIVIDANEVLSALNPSVVIPGKVVQ